MPARHSEASRVVVNDYAGHPFQIELSRSLAERGFAVTHLYCSTNVTPHGDLDTPTAGLEIVGVSTGRDFDKYHLVKRLIAEVRYGAGSVRRLIRQRPVVVVTSNVPLLSLVMIGVVAKLRRVRWVLWLQDVQAGLAETSLGGGRKGRLVGRVLGILERWSLRRADHVVGITEDFRASVVAAGGSEERFTVIPNWAPLNDLPERPRLNPWSARQDLDDRFVFLYSGTLGRKHSPGLLVDLAAVHEADDVQVVVVSEGEGAEQLEKDAADRGLTNLRVLPFQPFELLPDVMASADVLIVLLDAEAGRFSVPSKVLSYLCAARPILASVPGENAAAVLIDRIGAGRVVAPNSKDFVRAADEMRGDAELRFRQGRAGRAYADRTFDIRSITDRFEHVMRLEHDTEGT